MCVDHAVLTGGVCCRNTFFFFFKLSMDILLLCEIFLLLESAEAVLCVIKQRIPCRHILTGGLQRLNAG